MLAPSGTHAWCLGTSACVEPRGAEQEGDESLLLPRDVMLVTGSHQDSWEGCCWGRDGRAWVSLALASPSPRAWLSR